MVLLSPLRFGDVVLQRQEPQPDPRPGGADHRDEAGAAVVARRNGHGHQAPGGRRRSWQEPRRIQVRVWCLLCDAHRVFGSGLQFGLVWFQSLLTRLLSFRRFSGGFGSRDYRTSQPPGRSGAGSMSSSSRSSGGGSFPNYSAPPPSHGKSANLLVQPSAPQHQPPHHRPSETGKEPYGGSFTKTGKEPCGGSFFSLSGVRWWWGCRLPA